MRVLKGLFLTAILTAFAALPSAKADITITNFILTTTSVSFNISGSLPSQDPVYASNLLYFVNSNATADPGYNLGTSDADSFSSNVLSIYEVGANNGFNGDYFFIRTYIGDLFTNKPLNGSFTASWDSPAFDPSEVASINVFWGRDLGDDDWTTSGTFLTSVVPITFAIPEPSSLTMLGLAALGGYWLRRKKA